MDTFSPSEVPTTYRMSLIVALLAQGGATVVSGSAKSGPSNMSAAAADKHLLIVSPAITQAFRDAITASMYTAFSSQILQVIDSSAAHAATCSHGFAHLAS